MNDKPRSDISNECKDVEINEDQKEEINNFIVGEVEVKEDNKKIKLLNSIELLKRECGQFKDEYDFIGVEEIKDF